MPDLQMTRDGEQPDQAPGMEEALLRQLSDHDLRPSSRSDQTVMVQSFSRASLERLSALDPVDGAMITDFRNPQGTFDALVRELPPERVVAPRLLHISREKPTLME